MKFNVHYPIQGTQKSFEVDDDNKCRVFFEKRLGQEVEADTLGEEFKGYVFKITGGNDKDGFPMKQGVFSSGRVRLLLSTGTSCYRPRRSGERKRKSVRGCIVGPDIRALSVVIVKKGEKELPGVTDTTKARRLGPKRVSGIRKLYGLEKGADVSALIKKNVIRRTFASKKNAAAPQRQKAPKIQRLVTDARLRRKKIIKKEKVTRWQKTQAAVTEYQKLYNEWSEKKRKDLKAKEKAAETKAETKPAAAAATAAAPKAEKLVVKGTKTTTTTTVTTTKKDAPKATTKTTTTTTTTTTKPAAAAPAPVAVAPAPADDGIHGAHVTNTFTKKVVKVVKKN